MKKPTNVLSVFDWITFVGIRISAVFIFFAWVLIISEIFCRYVFNHPLVWSVETVEYLSLYSLFLGAAAVLKEEGHIKIDIVLNWLSSKNGAWLNSINSLFGIVVCLVLTWFGSKVTVNFYCDDVRTFTAMELPQWPFMMAIPIGSFLLLIQFVKRFFDNIALAKGSKG